NERGRGLGSLVLSRCGKWVRRLQADAHQKGIRQEHESEMTIPAEVAAHFILIESQSFGGLQVLFDVPPCANGLHHDGEGRLIWSGNEVISQFVGVVEATTDHKELSTVHGARRAQSKRRSPLVPRLCERRCQSPCRAMLATSPSLMPVR